MWFVLTHYTEGWEILSGPHKDEAKANASMLKKADTDGPKCALAYVKEVGQVVSTVHWEKVKCRS